MWPPSKSAYFSATPITLPCSSLKYIHITSSSCPFFNPNLFVFIFFFHFCQLYDIILKNIVMKGYGLMSSFQCPYCSNIMALSDDTLQNRFPGFRNHHDTDIYGYGESCIQIAFHMCPNCKEYTIFALGKGAKVSDINTVIRPKSLAKQFPDYIPKAIRQDYEESCAIINLSPKASATLSRRCL